MGPIEKRLEDRLGQRFDKRRGERRGPSFRAAAIAACALASGCGLDWITVDVEESTSIEGGSLAEEILGELGFPGLAEFDMTDTETFRNEGYTEDDIAAVHIDSFELAIAEPEGADFDFLRRIEFTVRAEGEPDERIAWADPVPEGASEIALEIDSNAELKPHVVAPEMQIETSARGRRPAEDTTVEARLAFDVQIRVF